MTYEPTVPDHVKEAQKQLEAAQDGATAPAEPQPETPPEKTAEEAAPQTPEVPPQETPKEAPAPVEPAPQAPSELDTVKAELERLRQAHAVLTGKYSAEVPRYAAERRELQERTRQLEAELEAAKTAQSEKDDADAVEIELSDEEKELGPEVLSVAKKMSEKMATRIVQRELKKLQRAAPPAPPESDFFNVLGALVPDWETVHDDPKFQTWLRETDPLTGVPRHRLLKATQDSNDPIRAANFFKVYSESQPKPQPSPKPSAPKPSVASQVAPVTVSVPAQPKPKGKVWALKDWEEEYGKIARGNYTVSRAKEIQNELDAAAREGRIQ